LKRLKRWQAPCDGCGEPIHISFYMIHDDLWKQSAKPQDRYLCLACVEKRLDRKLTKADFQNLPINYIHGHLPYEEAPIELRKHIIGDWMYRNIKAQAALKRQRRPDPEEVKAEQEFSKWLAAEWARLQE